MGKGKRKTCFAEQQVRNRIVTVNTKVENGGSRVISHMAREVD